MYSHAAFVARIFPRFIFVRSHGCMSHDGSLFQGQRHFFLRNQKALGRARPVSTHFTPKPGAFSIKASCSDKFTVGVVCPLNNPALAKQPKMDDVNFIIGNTLDQFTSHPDYEQISALLYIVPGDANVLSQIYDHKKHTAPVSIQWVHSFYAGVDALAPFIKEHLLDKTTPLTNGRGAFASSLAEYVMSCIFYFNKQIQRCQHNREAKKWDKFVMDVVQGKTIGFLGFGNIARMTASVAKNAFGMKVIAVRRSKNDPSDTLADEIYTEEEKLMVFQKSDYIISTLPGTPSTWDYIGPGEIAVMKDTAVFISIGRGTVVDEVALAQALKQGKIRGAAMDVFKTEPLPESSPLWDCDNLLMTSHNADYTEDYFELGWQVWHDNYHAYVSGHPPVTLVDKRAGY